MELTRLDNVCILLRKEESEAVKIAALNLAEDIRDVIGCNVAVEDTVKHVAGDDADKVIVIETDADVSAHKEYYRMFQKNSRYYITGSDRRGTVYGIYTLSEMLGVSPWHFFADVPKKKRDKFAFPKEMIEDFPDVEYRGIFINDEEELEHWVQTYMGEKTIGVKTYEKVFELLLRLKMNYIWPAMHVNSFNIVKENGALADRMGIVVGTSHCDMLMRSNNREWKPWLEKKGYTDVKYDFSIPGRNREILTEYWRESVEQNKDFEVSYTLGMRGVHDSGFNVESLKNLSGKELLDAKIKLLEEVIEVQQNLLKEGLNKDTMKIFVPYKEVLVLYDNGLKVPEDLTLIWVNDNYGYVRRYPNEAERKRKGGNGLYYHNSYWAPAGNSYMFINSIPLAHTKNELEKAYAEGIQKLWVTNFGAMKPLEMQMHFFADLAWEGGRGNGTKTGDVDKWTEAWLKKTFTGLDAEKLGKYLNDFDRLTNVRKIEHLEADAFSLTSYGDEGAYRLQRYKEMFDYANEAYRKLPDNEKDAFFQLVLMKIHAAYYSNAMFYYADRSNLCMKQGKGPAALEYTELSLKFDKLRRQMLYYYNHIMSGGKWNNILTPEDFPPPRTAMFPPCMPPLFTEKKGLSVSTWGGKASLEFTNDMAKWIDIGNTGEGELKYEINAPDWAILSKTCGLVKTEERILVSVKANADVSGFITITAPETAESQRIFVSCKTNQKGFDDNRLIVEADDFSCKSDDASIVYGLGRDHGNLLQLNGEGSTVSYRIEVPETGDYTFVIHRFPTLNSVGRIRCRIAIDSRNPFIYEAPTNDEHKASWKHNVQNNVDDTVSTVFPLDKGTHTITIQGIDKYFAFSRFVFYYGTPRRDVLAAHCYATPLPETFDMEAFSKVFYTDFELPHRKEVFAVRGVTVENLNTDYDTYVDMQTEPDLDDFSENHYRTASHILESGEKAFVEKDGIIRIDAAAALINAGFASVEGENRELVTYCNSTSYEGTGLALYIREKGEEFDFDNAPVLKYIFETEEETTKTLWIKLFWWNWDREGFALTIDGKDYTKKDFLKPGPGYFSSENTWRNVPIIDINLKPGRHELKLHLISREMRVDRLVFADRNGELAWN